jgi:hypothetical protein
MEIVCVCIPGLAGLRGKACRVNIVQGCASLRGRGLAEIKNVCASLALKVHPTEILHF